MNRSESMAKLNVTRGYGLLERFLAQQRGKLVDKLIPYSYRKGRILDIGCGTYPLFLLETEFSEKYGLDKVVQEIAGTKLQNQKLTLTNYDIEREDTMPFDSEYFDVVTMLAVFEHLEPRGLMKILGEIYRVLKPGGMYIMTTPAVWTNRLLKLMAGLRLVSPVEILEHKDAYKPSKIFSILQEASFLKNKLQFGYFEMFVNTWVTAKK